jgi:hypothetical protein
MLQRPCAGPVADVDAAARTTVAKAALVNGLADHRADQAFYRLADLGLFFR